MNILCNDQKSLYRQIIGGLYDALLVTDPNGHILQLNPRACDYFQYAEGELMDKTIAAVLPDFGARMLARIRNDLAGSRHAVFDAVCLRKDGSQFLSEVSVSSIDLLSKKDLMFVVRNSESQRKHVEQLRSYCNAFKCSLSAAFVCDASRIYRSVNAAFLKMFGLESDMHVIGQPFEQYLSDEPLPLFFERALAGECVHCRIVADAESDGPVGIDVQMMPDLQKNRIVGVVGSVVRAV